MTCQTKTGDNRRQILSQCHIVHGNSTYSVTVGLRCVQRLMCVQKSHPVNCHEDTEKQ